MKLIRKIGSFFDGTISLLGYLSGAVIIFIMLAIGYDVFMRYFLSRPQAWVLEVTEYCLLYMAFLGTSWVLAKEGHVKMDLVLERLKPRTQYMVNIITSIIGAIVFLIIAWYGAQVTWQNFQGGYIIPSWLMPPKALILVVIPVCSFLFSMQFLRRSYGYLGRWRDAIKPETKGIEETIRL
ncbi:TRAP transporter small permease [Chloroflexota bacterium]